MFERIIWATDGSASADAALTEVKRLAADGGRIVAVHCTQLLTGRAGGFTAEPEEPEVIDKIEEQVAQLQADGYRAELVMHRAYTSVADTIAAVAAAEEADLIVCGTHGLTALAGAITGSVSHRLLHSAHAPVLVVPEGAVAPEPPAKVPAAT
jgi:nucleotide-binding universal stress UspA family protein